VYTKESNPIIAELSPEDRRSDLYSESPSPRNGPILEKYPSDLPIDEVVRLSPGGHSMKIRVLVGEDGTVKRIRILIGLPNGVTDAVANRIYSFRYRPATKDGRPVEAWGNFEAEFNVSPGAQPVP
jgi:hypothetical protein